MTHSLLRQALARLDDAACRGRFASHLIEALHLPRETMAARLDVAMDDGARRSFRAWRCRYDDALGPTLGGVRFDAAGDADLVEALALSATIGHAAMALPFGGAHGLIQADRAELSPGEAERLSRAYVRAFAPMIGEARDMLAPDRGVDAATLGWMADEYRTLTPLAFSISGSLTGADDAAADGGFHLLRHLESRLALGPGSTVAIQGFGEVGSHMARLLDRAGYIVVAISTSRFGFHAPRGLPVGKLLAGRTSAMLEAAGTAAHIRRISPDAIVGSPCDLLITAADHSLIDTAGAHEVRAKVVLELAAASITPEAERLLHASGATVLPDLLATAARAFCVSFERSQGCDREKVQGLWRSAIVEKADEIWKSAEAQGITMRAEIYARGLGRITAATEARHRAGTSPVFERIMA